MAGHFASESTTNPLSDVGARRVYGRQRCDFQRGRSPDDVDSHVSIGSLLSPFSANPERVGRRANLSARQSTQATIRQSVASEARISTRACQRNLCRVHSSSPSASGDEPGSAASSRPDDAARRRASSSPGVQLWPRTAGHVARAHSATKTAPVEKETGQPKVQRCLLGRWHWCRPIANCADALQPNGRRRRRNESIAGDERGVGSQHH